MLQRHIYIYIYIYIYIRFDILILVDLCADVFHYECYVYFSCVQYKPGYSLTQGKTFPSIPMLLSHYKQEELPRSPNITLSEPYHPLDH